MNHQDHLRSLSIGPKTLFSNLDPDTLEQHSLSKDMAVRTSHGALALNTGKFTGRSPEDRFIVKDALTQDSVWWGPMNKPFDPEKFQQLKKRVCNYLNGKDVYVRDAYAGAHSSYRMNIRVINEYPWSNQFAYNMFLRPSEAELENFEYEWTVINAPGFLANPELDGTRQENFAILDFTDKTILIGGTGYTGEIKKGIFSALNFILPFQKDVLSMHCSANVNKDGKVALFFGLSGTGKTTLSADPTCSLIGDDEHGWGPGSVFNFEGGCYAKTIDLSEKNEPVIFKAIKHGSIIENVYLDSNLTPDYYNTSLSENGRVCYPRSHIEGAVPENASGEPETVIFLTCDLTGVMPPVSILSKEAAAYHFLSGYTAKVGSTEIGSTSSIESAFSTCFGAPFFPRPAGVYADLLMKRMESFGSKVFLVNTGWTGGPHGVGSRFSIPTTRRIVNAIQNGELANVETTHLSGLNLNVPKRLEGVDQEILNPRNTWDDKNAYDIEMKSLIAKFKKNFEKFDLSDNIIAAGPDF